jgi:HSP20 family molecular chaperone IbpA
MITSNETGYTLKLEVPGVKPEDISLEARGKYLTATVKGREYVWTMAPETFNTEGITASLDLGILTIELPFSERQKPKRIEIQTGQIEEGRRAELRAA